MTTITNAAGRRIDFDAAAKLMDDEISAELDRDSWLDEQEYFYAYCQRHAEKHGEEFEPNKQNPVW